MPQLNSSHAFSWCRVSHLVPYMLGCLLPLRTKSSLYCVPILQSGPILVPVAVFHFQSSLWLCQSWRATLAEFRPYQRCIAGIPTSVLFISAAHV